ncbi:hypothetical protein [Arthrobacter sp. RHLT1-20]
MARAREALVYQPWRTVWESAKAIVGATSGPDDEGCSEASSLLSGFI